MVASFFRKGREIVSSQQTSIMSAATVITALVFVSAVLGFIKQRFLFSFFPGEVMRLQVDAFLVAFRIPDFLFQLLVAGVLSATFIPVFTRLQHKDPHEARAMTNELITQLSVIYILFAIVIGFFAPQIIRLMTGPKFSNDQVILAAQMTRLMLGSTFFLLLSNFLSGILQSNKQFLLPALSPAMYNLGIIFGIVVLSRYFGIYGPALGVVLGSLAHFLIQLPLARSLGFAFKPQFSFRNKDVFEVNRLMLPRGATLTTNYIEDFVGLYVVTSIGSTLVLLYNSAYQLAAAPIRLFGISIAQAALPFLSLKAKEQDMRGFTDLVTRTLHQIAFFMFPAGVLLLILRIPIVRLVLGARELPWSDTVLMGRLVAIYSFSIAALAMTHVVLRAYYALTETKIPFVFAVISMIINISIMVVGSFVLNWGLIAVALGPSVAAIVEFLLLLIVLFRRVGYFSASDFFIPQLKMLLATLLMGVALYIPMKFLDQVVFDTTRVMGLLALTSIVSLVGILVYLLFSRFIGVEQLSIVASIQGRLKGWQAKLVNTQEILGVEEETKTGSSL